MENYFKEYIEQFFKKKIKKDKFKNNKDVSVITCTNLSNSLNNILDNFNRQDYEKKELIIVINKNSIDENKWKEKIAKYDNIRVFKLDENFSLGKCLNFGISKSKYNIIAKFDDDDYYGPKYLSDSIKYFSTTNAGLIGKGATIVYLVGSKILTIRNPSEENKYTNFVNGSTLIFKREVFNKVRFRDMTVAEDINFCNDCIKAGIKIYSCNKYHHAYFRHPSMENHTWKIKDKEFIDLCCRIDILNKHIDNIDDIKPFVDI
jgi:cellulose synthase/poly-beta-1,6-N-acetylglucosamine synthase-like glycosyltransferase